MGQPGPTAWMIIPTFTPVVGGAQTQVHQLAGALRASGWPVQVLTRRHSYAHPQGLPAREQVRGLPVRRVYSRGGKLGSLLFLLTGLWSLRESRGGAIFHAHDAGAAGWLAVAAARLWGGKSLVKLRTGAYAYRQDFASRLARWQMLALLRLVDRVVVVNREVQGLLGSLGIPASRIACIPNGVDTRRYRPATAEEKAAARQSLGFRPDELAALYVGRLEHMKGVDILLRGWACLQANRPAAARLALVGDGPERAGLERLAEELGLRASVSFLGEQGEVLPYYQAADLLLLPSRTEGLSNALLEAMACGLPVLVSRVGGAVDLVTDPQNGLFFESGDEVELAGKLCLLLASPDLRAALGARARETARAFVSLDLTAARVEGVYRELVGGRF